MQLFDNTDACPYDHAPMKNSQGQSQPIILDGRALAAELREALRVEVAQFQEQTGVTPRLDVVQVAGDAASAWYARAIRRACQQVGMAFELTQLPADIPQTLLLERMQVLNSQPETHGIIVQVPLPPHLNADAVIGGLDPGKDVDGLHPLNQGRLAQGLPALVPNTPAGGLELLRHYAIPLEGKHAVVVGRSNVVGKPMALLLLRENATVTIAHSRTVDLPALLRGADLVVVAVGRRGLVTGTMLKPGAVVVDFGINEVAEGQVVGDVEYSSAVEVAGAITPVPGGTGPVTNVMLLRNVLAAAKAQH